MLRRTFISAAAVLAVLAASGAAQADDKGDVQAAVNKLANSANYSWTVTTENQGGFGGGGGAAAPTTGKTEKDGYTMVTAPAFGGGRGGRGGRRGGGGGGGGMAGAGGGGDAAAPAPTPPAPLEVVMKGDKTVVKIGNDWKTTDELTAAAAAGAGGGGGGGGGFNMGPEQQAMFAVGNIPNPTKQVQDAAAKLDNVKKTDDGYTADLNADVVKGLLAFKLPAGMAGGFTPPEVTDPKGTIKVWIANGLPTKIQMHLNGSMDFGGNPNAIDRTTTIEIKDVGSTKVVVPEDAKKKLDAAK